MRKYVLVSMIACVTAVTACSAPTLQSDIFAKSASDMHKIDSECANTVSHKQGSRVEAIDCRFNAYEVLLGEQGFEEFNDLDTLRKHFLYIAKKQDAHKISEGKAVKLSEDYTQEFYKSLQLHDNIKLQGYELQNRIIQQDIQIIALGLATGLQAYSDASYSSNASYQLSCPACVQGANAGQANANRWQQQGVYEQQNMQNSAYHYDNPPPAPLGMGQGVRGYNGKVYIPAGSDPNPPAHEPEQ